MPEKNKTLILGASTNPDRYSYIAALKLKRFGFETILVGKKRGEVDGQQIINSMEAFDSVDTITLYLNPAHQKEYYDYILSLKPRRIIFNPGTENEELELLATKHGIQTEESCTLVLLSINQY